jgi:sorbitol-specific phosphotransferase system component IIBC
LQEIAVEEAESRRKRRREVLAAVLGVVAVVLIWRAIWDMTAAIMSPLTSLAIGLVLIGVIAYLNKDYLKELF